MTPIQPSEVEKAVRDMQTGKAPGLNEFANDLLFFLTSPITTLPSLMLELEIYSTLTNLKINFIKSEALDISLPPKILDALRQIPVLVGSRVHKVFFRYPNTEESGPGVSP